MYVLKPYDLGHMKGFAITGIGNRGADWIRGIHD
jgi:hypothetical protein